MYWNSLIYQPNGLNGSVYALEYLGSDLYVGGSFSTIHNLSGINNIVKWVGLTPTDGYWEPIVFQGGYGVDGIVRALASTGSEMYVGGAFLNTGSLTNLNYIGKWTNPSTWSQITYSGNIGLNNTVLSLSFRAVSNEILIGGTFTETNGSALALYRVASCSTGSLLFNQVIDAAYAGTSGPVNAVLANGLYRYVGGSFLTTSGTSSSPTTLLIPLMITSFICSMVSKSLV